MNIKRDPELETLWQTGLSTVDGERVLRALAELKGLEPDPSLLRKLQAIPDRPPPGFQWSVLLKPAAVCAVLALLMLMPRAPEQQKIAAVEVTPAEVALLILADLEDDGSEDVLDPEFGELLEVL